MRPASGWSPDCEPVILAAMPTDVPLSGREAPAGIALVGASAALGAEPPATSRSTQRAPLSSANLLLNCLFHADLKAAADLARRRAGRTMVAGSPNASPPWPHPSATNVGIRATHASTRWTSSAWTAGPS
jgi:hypothetical protein